MSKYAIERGEEGWAVFDRGTGRSVRIDGRLQNDLSFSDATALAVALNRIASHKADPADKPLELTDEDLAASHTEREVANLRRRPRH